MLSPWMSHGNIHDYIAANGFIEDEVHRLVCAVAASFSRPSSDIPFYSFVKFLAGFPFSINLTSSMGTSEG